MNVNVLKDLNNMKKLLVIAAMFGRMLHRLCHLLIGNEIYEIATPAPKAMLKEELQELFGDDYRNIVTEFNSTEGLESVLMFNISKNDISKIAENIGDVLVFKIQLRGRKSII